MHILHIICIVYAKYQGVSVKAPVQVDTCIHYLSKTGKMAQFIKAVSLSKFGSKHLYAHGQCVYLLLAKY